MNGQSQHQIRQFVGLASYYRQYIQCLAEISKPLTQKNVPFVWSDKCNVAFKELKTQLLQVPVSTYTRLGYGASQFVLRTDASAYGIGAVLEQDGLVVAYISRALSKAEQQYSVIQKECLGAVYAMKQLHHSLLGRPFKLVTNHKPLQWLSTQKMEGLLTSCLKRNCHISAQKNVWIKLGAPVKRAIFNVSVCQVLLTTRYKNIENVML